MVSISCAGAIAYIGADKIVEGKRLRHVLCMSCNQRSWVSDQARYCPRPRPIVVGGPACALVEHARCA